MQRIRIAVRYDGTEFSGSQVQPGQRTVEGTLKEGLESLLRQDVKLLFASRTDAGVHADGNVAAFDAEPAFPVEKLPELMRRELPPDVEIYGAQAVDSGFHPRFDAVSRTYVYRYFQGELPPVDRRRYCATFEGNWDAAVVNEVLVAIHGTHDFAEYANTGDMDGGTECSISEARQELTGNEVSLTITANRFLRNMICRLAGAVALVASGKITPKMVISGLSSPIDFKLKPAPPRGLTLLRVDY